MSGQRSDQDTLRHESLICAQCGACRDVCPAFRQLGWESSSPRGRMSVVKDLTTKKPGVSAATDEQVRTLCQCTMCGACREICAARIDTTELWLEARAALAGQGKALSQFSRLAEGLRDAKNIASFDNETRLEWADDLDEGDVLDPQAEKVEVLYYVGCMASFYPRSSQVALAMAEVMKEADVRFAALGGEEWCCGFPFEASGHPEEARAFQKHNLERILASGVKKVVTGCPTCFHTLNHDLGDALREGGVELLHETQFLLELIREDRLQLNGLSKIVTYHDPCDLGRNSGIYDEPREILRSIPDLTFVELHSSREGSACCGGGGNLQTVDPGLTDKIADARVDEIVESGAEIVVSACQQCEQVLAAAIQRRGLKVRVMDISELVLESLA
jgi:heterodisulfide reductase subunit D